MVDDWELDDCNLDEALEWAEEKSHGNPFELLVRAGSLGFYRLKGCPADEAGAQEDVILRTNP